MKVWTSTQIKQHREAARLLGAVKDETLQFIRENKKSISEEEVRMFIKKSYKKQGLVNDEKKEFAIAAFGTNTSFVHYFPKGKGAALKNNDLILLDIWARLDQKSAPYADMTWMAFCGKEVPADIETKWHVLKKSRDTSLSYLERKLKKKILPRGLDLDRASHDVLGHAGFGSNIKHTIGHSLGFTSPHGDLPGINWREYAPLLQNIGYTIEPGMYFENKLGLRTEIDFYIDDKNQIVVTTPTQNKIDII